MELILINVGFLLLATVSWVIYNLYTKNKKLEELFTKQSNMLFEVVGMMKNLDSTVEKIDSKVWSAADVELSGLIDSVKEIQSRIKEYLGV